MKTIIALLTVFTTLISPIYGLMALTTIMIGIDTGYGIYVSTKLNKKFRSTKFTNLFHKLFYMLGSIMVCFFIDYSIFGKSLFGVEFLLAKIVTGMVVFNEINSVSENYVSLDPKKNKSFWVMLKNFISKMKELKKDISNIVEEDK